MQKNELLNVVMVTFMVLHP